MAAPTVAVIPVDRELSKIPHFFGQKEHDTVLVEYWVERIDRLQDTHKWTDQQTANNAYNSLRGHAIQMGPYLQQTEPDTLYDWKLFRAAMLRSYGTSAKDTSSIANLNIQQEKDETVNRFAHRVAICLKEFFQAAKTPLTSIEMDIVKNDRRIKAEPARFREVFTESNDEVLIIIQATAEKTAVQIKNYISMCVFINGLRPDLRLLVKQTKPDSLAGAVSEAITAEKNLQGPASQTLALQVPESSTTQVSAIRSSYGRGRGNYRSRGRGFSGRGRTGPSMTSSMECWYCQAKGHAQIDCRKRISRGAALVKRPRTVQEIEMDCYAYQDSDIPHEESDDYLNQSLAAVDTFHTAHEDEYEESDGYEYIAAINLN